MICGNIFGRGSKRSLIVIKGLILHMYIILFDLEFFLAPDVTSICVMPEYSLSGDFIQLHLMFNETVSVTYNLNLTRV